LQDWIEREGIQDEELVNTVRRWSLTRQDDPYRGARRAPALDESDLFENYWYMEVPGTRHGGYAVNCTFFVHEQKRVVECDGFTTLPLPF
jgi:hypothetical protein